LKRQVVTILNPSLGSKNLGDVIIVDEVMRHLEPLFSEFDIQTVSTHIKMTSKERKKVRHADYQIVAGTNLLSSKMYSYRQWNIGFREMAVWRDILLMGVGWWQYQNEPDLYTRTLLRTILHEDLWHSVRDSYTLKKLNSIGLNNVLNTGCPTLWKLDELHCRDIPQKKAKAAVVTLTDYNRNRVQDAKFIQFMAEHYEDLYFWPQGTGDIAYIEELNIRDLLTVLPENVDAYKKLLEEYEGLLDYAGTRLHAGIMALRKKRRSLILSIDNRAEEIAMDTGLPVVKRGDFEKIEQMLLHSRETRLSIPFDTIETWKNQFR